MSEKTGYPSNVREDLRYASEDALLQAATARLGRSRGPDDATERRLIHCLLAAHNEMRRERDEAVRLLDVLREQGRALPSPTPPATTDAKGENVYDRLLRQDHVAVNAPTPATPGEDRAWPCNGCRHDWTDVDTGAESCRMPAPWPKDHDMDAVSSTRACKYRCPLDMGRDVPGTVDGAAKKEARS